VLRVESLGLDPGGYGGSYKLIGGRLSLDFVNTVSYHNQHREHDWFDPPTNIARWLRAAGLVNIAAGPPDLAAIIEMRTRMSAVLDSLARHDQPAAEDVERFNADLARASTRRRLDPGRLTWTWSDPVSALDAFAAVVEDAADVITSADRSRLRHCPGCGWLFEDHTRNNRRRWCDMADCGSRAKARAYYQRRHP